MTSSIAIGLDVLNDLLHAAYVSLYATPSAASLKRNSLILRIGRLEAAKRAIEDHIDIALVARGAVTPLKAATENSAAAA
jgi:hypothetical protein